MIFAPLLHPYPSPDCTHTFTGTPWIDARVGIQHLAVAEEHMYDVGTD